MHLTSLPGSKSGLLYFFTERNLRALYISPPDERLDMSFTHSDIKAAFPGAQTVRMLGNKRDFREAHVFFKTMQDMERLIEEDVEVKIKGEKQKLGFIGIRAKGI